MIQFSILAIGVVLMQCFGITVCLKIIRNKSIIASHRWVASMIVFLLPFVGVFFFKAFKPSLRYKEYRFFSEDFIRQML